jgi:hypothetical protein
VLVEGHLYGERVWFSDTRSPVRRMGISTHPVDSTIVISLWQGDICTGTFRLPARDAASVISTLAHGMAASVRDPGQEPQVGATRRGSLWSRLVGRLFVRPPADTPLRLVK